MPKLLTEDQIERFREDGFLCPVPVLTPEEAAAARARLESVEARHPGDVKKLKSKAHVLCPWVGDIARHPRILDAFEDLIGADILCYSMAFRAKEADGATFAGWHQDSAYSRIRPLVVLGALALSDCTPASGCLRAIPGSHQWGALPHAETGDAASILARGQYISAEFDSSSAVDLVLRPGEIGFFDYRVVHGSGPNSSSDRRIMLLVEMMPSSARQTEGRESAMLVRGEDRHGNFDADPRPDAELSEASLAAWREVVGLRAKTIYSDSHLPIPEAYGGGSAKP